MEILISRIANVKLISGLIDDCMSNCESDNEDVHIPSDD